MTKEIYIRQLDNSNIMLLLLIDDNGEITVVSYEGMSKTKRSNPCLVQNGVGMDLEYGMEHNRQRIPFTDSETRQLTKGWAKVM